jgi:tetratricopeptide (TPR) repeat protein
VGRAQARDQIKAEELYRQALEIDANHSYSLRNLGILLAHKGDHGAAQGLLERLVARDPTSASGHYILACAHASGGRKPAMLAALKQAIALDPSTRQQMLKERDFDAFKSDADFVALSADGSR